MNSEYAQAGIGGASSARLGGIQNVNTNIAAEKGKMAQQLYDMGMQELGMSGSTYQNVFNDSLASDQMITQTITDFASALAGGGPGQPVSVPGGGQISDIGGTNALDTGNVDWTGVI